MSKKGPLVSLRLDQSFLDSSFQHINSQLTLHEDMIRELQKLLKDQPNRNEIFEFRDKILSEINAKTDQLKERMDGFENKIEEKIRNVEDNFEKRLLETANLLNLSFRQKFEELEKRIPEEKPVYELEDRIKTIESNLFTTGKKAQLTRDYVSQVVSAVSLLNSNKNDENTPAKLDNRVYENLKESVTSVTDNFDTLYKEIERLKENLKEQRQYFEMKTPEMIPVLQEMRKGESEFDITSIRPYPQMVAHWRDPPELPTVHPFLNIGEVVDYIYRIVPKLQAHMTAMQSKIVENATEIGNKVDKPILEKLFDKFQGLIGEMSRRIAELQAEYSKTASRDEINTIIEDILKAMTQEAETSVGRLKCMACGRDIPQVVGASTEEEAERSLGQPTSSTVFHVNRSNASAVRYNDTENFNSEIIEAPISIRPSKISTRMSASSKNGMKPK